MVKSLWSAASGMTTQQTAVDTISNNIANVNTIGYKTEQAEFKSLLYQTIQVRTTSANGDQKPIPAQVGLGARLSSITSQFTQGSLQESSSDTAFAIAGDGFFSVQGANGQTYYTRNGDFTWSLGNDGRLTLSTSDGYAVLDSNGQPIKLPEGVASNKVYVSDNGFYYTDDAGNPVDLNQQFGIYQFRNPEGLNKVGDSLYEVTVASGGALNEATTQGLEVSSIKSGYLESSNVDVAEEMVDLIVAQRAYEMNSKAIQASDDMLSQANSLRR